MRHTGDLRIIRFTACLGLLTLFSVHGQVSIEPRAQPAAKDPSPPTLRVDTTLVLVPVTVTDDLSRPVTGLEKANFRVLDDKIPQTITQFAMEDAPVAVGFVFDVNESGYYALLLTPPVDGRVAFELVEGHFDGTRTDLIPRTPIAALEQFGKHKLAAERNRGQLAVFVDDRKVGSVRETLFITG